MGLYSGPAEGEGLVGFSFPPPKKKNFELLKESVFSPPPHFESLVIPSTFKVAPRSLYFIIVAHTLAKDPYLKLILTWILPY